MGYQLPEAFKSLHALLASAIHRAGPWAIPMVIAVAGLIALANRDRLISGFGVFLVFATAGAVTVVIAFQTGRF